jgi:hypothetical protein
MALELLKYSIPLLIFGITILFLVKWFLNNDNKRRKQEMVLENHKLIMPLRLQAYERMALFLERISPDSILVRYNVSTLNSRQLQNELLTAIRLEFEHNMTQQVYISREAWEKVKNARSKITQIINKSADSLDPNSPAINLSRSIIERIMDLDKSPVTDALELLKKEMNNLW